MFEHHYYTMNALTNLAEVSIVLTHSTVGVDEMGVLQLQITQ